jgi:hypothetical protein
MPCLTWRCRSTSTISSEVLSAQRRGRAHRPECGAGWPAADGGGGSCPAIIFGSCGGGGSCPAFGIVASCPASIPVCPAPFGSHAIPAIRGAFVPAFAPVPAAAPRPGTGHCMSDGIPPSRASVLGLCAREPAPPSASAPPLTRVSVSCSCASLDPAAFPVVSESVVFPCVVPEQPAPNAHHNMIKSCFGILLRRRSHAARQCVTRGKRAAERKSRRTADFFHAAQRSGDIAGCSNA